MLRLLIEVAHENKKDACDRAVAIFKSTGSHFLTNADWGCADNIHKAWIIADLESKEEAMNIVPVWFRPHAKIITLHKFALEGIDDTIQKHNT